MGTIDFILAEKDSARERESGTAAGMELADIFISLRDLLSAAGDSNDSSAAAAAAIADFIRVRARQAESCEEARTLSNSAGLK